ncbi:MAG: hypothetical protein R2800_14790 [Flavipsychrobacter sp.]
MRNCKGIILVFLVFLAACSKSDNEGPDISDKLTNPYCNDPEAINYNWGFPGRPDNTTCFYPKDIFVGVYSFSDSIYNANLELKKVNDITLTIYANSNNILRVTGFCSNTDSIRLTADRFYRSYADSTITNDSVVLDGQIVCRTVDTLSGYLIKDKNDSTKLSVNITVASDTGLNFHLGTAYKK